MPTNQAATLLSIESLINSHDTKLSTLQKELSVQKEMLNNILENDEEYGKVAQEAAKLAKQKTIAKQKVLHTQNGVTIMEKVKELASQQKELKVALSDYLSQYVSLSGTNQFEGSDGITRQITFSAKLIKKQD
ncbi:MAG: hypothetical protein WAV41_05260 [Microgenomates group bacterium]